MSSQKDLIWEFYYQNIPEGRCLCCGISELSIERKDCWTTTPVNFFLSQGYNFFQEEVDEKIQNIIPICYDCKLLLRSKTLEQLFENPEFTGRRYWQESEPQVQHDDGNFPFLQSASHDEICKDMIREMQQDIQPKYPYLYSFYMLDWRHNSSEPLASTSTQSRLLYDISDLWYELFYKTLLGIFCKAIYPRIYPRLAKYFLMTDSNYNTHFDNNVFFNDLNPSDWCFRSIIRHGKTLEKRMKKAQANMLKFKTGRHRLWLQEQIESCLPYIEHEFDVHKKTKNTDNTDEQLNFNDIHN